jgi:hypothetical protein
VRTLLRVAFVVILVATATASAFLGTTAAPPVSGNHHTQAAPVVSSYAGSYIADIPNRYRSPVCAGPSQFRAIAVYARAADGPDRYWSTVDDIRYAVMRANSFVHDTAQRLGVERLDFKFECAKNHITVLNAVLSTPSWGDSFNSIETDLRALGLRDTTVKYWVWYDGGPPTGACGEARRPGDGSLSEGNAANTGPHYAVAYAATRSCGSMASTMLHEATHTMGAVDTAAWGTDRAGHCVDGMDIMCGSGRICPTLQYDCGNDSYFDPRPAKGEYLFGHWNIAFCVNHFVSRTGCVTQPRNLRSAYSGYGVTLRWSPPLSSGGAPLWTYEIYRRSCKDCPFSVIDTVAGSRTSYTDPNLGFRYEYRLRAVNVWRDGGPLSNLVVGGIL